MVRWIKKLFKRKETEKPEKTNEYDNFNFSLTFKMPKSIFKDMLPIISERKVFPIVFGEEEVRKIVKEFMVNEKSKIELDYGDI